MYSYLKEPRMNLQDFNGFIRTFQVELHNFKCYFPMSSNKQNIWRTSNLMGDFIAGLNVFNSV